MNIAKVTNQCQVILDESSYKNSRVLGILIEFSIRYARLQMRHEYIAQLAGCSVSTVKRCIAKYVSLGVLSSSYIHMRSSIYKISPIFKNYAFKLMCKIPFLQKFALPESAFGWYGVPDRIKNSFLKQNELHITKGSLLNPVSIYTRERYIPEPTYIPKNGVVFKNIFLKRRSMIEFVPCPELRELTKLLNLSKWGQIRMSPFAGIIISQAIKSFKKLSVCPKDPFSWIFMACKTLSDSSATSIDWDKFYTLKEQHGMRDDAQMVLPRTISVSVDPESYRVQTAGDRDKIDAIIQAVKCDPKKSAIQKMFESMLFKSTEI